MNNEPVALTQVEIMEALTLGIPLYTHPVNPKYDPETGEPLIDGYPLFSGLPHPVKELTPCEELRAFQEQQNGVFSDHNACCYRHECRIVWDDWEKLRSNPVKEITDEEMHDLMDEIRQAVGDDIERAMYRMARAILRKASEK